MAGDEIVRVDAQAGVMTVTLADVDNRNALGSALVAAVGDALDRANADDTVRAVVLTNEGSTWCAGASRGYRPK